jgi:hypothetical protein
MQEIAHWLKALSTSEYAPLFAENRIDLSVPRDLTARSRLKFLAGSKWKRIEEWAWRRLFENGGAFGFGSAA